MKFFVNDSLTYSVASHGSIGYCTILEDQEFEVTMKNLSDKSASVGFYCNVDGEPVRKLQASFAPSFTMLPMFVALALSSSLTHVKPRARRRTLIPWGLFYLLILPLLAAVIFVQLSLFLHFWAGGAFVAASDYYWIPFTYVSFFPPLQYLPSIAGLSAAILGVYLFSAVSLICSAYVVWRVLYDPASRELARLLTRSDLTGLIYYYYLAGALFAVTLIGISAYGPESMMQWLSIPYVAPVLPYLALFGVTQSSMKVAIHLMILGVVLAIVTRLWNWMRIGFRRGTFSKMLTLISLWTLLALLWSPKLSDNYYAAVSAIGFSLIPFFAVCIVTALGHWSLARLLDSVSKRTSASHYSITKVRSQDQGELERTHACQ
jgi:hypothetical protein